MYLVCCVLCCVLCSPLCYVILAFYGMSTICVTKKVSVLMFCNQKSVCCTFKEQPCDMYSNHLANITLSTTLLLILQNIHGNRYTENKKIYSQNRVLLASRTPFVSVSFPTEWCLMTHVPSIKLKDKSFLSWKCKVLHAATDVNWRRVMIYFRHFYGLCSGDEQSMESKGCAGFVGSLMVRQ